MAYLTMHKNNPHYGCTLSGSNDVRKIVCSHRCSLQRHSKVNPARTYKRSPRMILSPLRAYLTLDACYVEAPVAL